MQTFARFIYSKAPVKPAARKPFAGFSFFVLDSFIYTVGGICFSPCEKLRNQILRGRAFLFKGRGFQKKTPHKIRKPYGNFKVFLSLGATFFSCEPFASYRGKILLALSRKRSRSQKNSRERGASSMNAKASSLHILKLFYRFGFLIIALPIEAILRERLGVKIFIPLYISNIVLCVLLVIFAVKSRRSTRISKTEDILCLSRGVFLKDKAYLFQSRISLTLVLRKPHYSILRSRKVFLFSGTLKKSIYLTASDAERILKKRDSFTHKSKLFGVFITALGLSSLIPEALAMLPLIKQATTLVGKDTAEKIFRFLEEESKLLLRFLPHSLRLLALALLILWGLCSVFSVLNLQGLRFSVIKKEVFARFGVLNRVFCRFKLSDISALTLSKNLLAMPFSIRLCYLHLPVKGRYSKLPIAIGRDEKKLKSILDDLGFPCDEKKEVLLKGESLWGYTYPAMLSLILLSLLCILGGNLPYRDLQRALLFPFVILSVIWFFLRFISFRKAALLLSGNHLIMKSFHSLSLAKTHIPLSKIVSIKQSQSIFQKFKSRCSLRIYLISPKGISFKISHVSIKKSAQLFSLCGLKV